MINEQSISEYLKPSVAILSSASGGGAGIAAKRLCDALNHSQKASADFIDVETIGQTLPPTVTLPGSLSNHTISDTHFTVEYPGYARGWFVEMLSGYDLVNVHWASYLISLTELFMLAEAGKPLLFTMHDFHYMTGGCHYPATCRNLEHGCKSCPQLDWSRCSPSVIQTNLGIKREIFSHPNVHIIAPSKFLRDHAVKSIGVPEERAHVLRNVYEPLEEPEIVLDPIRIRIVLIADSLAERRKQMRLATESLGVLRQKNEALERPFEIQVDLIGQYFPELQELLARSGLPHEFHGRITDHAALTKIMSRSNILLTCSNEDNWPNVLVEAGSYGCVPVVGPGHGCEEFVRCFGFGEVAEEYTELAFADALLRAASKREISSVRSAVNAIRQAHSTDVVLDGYAKIAEKMGLKFDVAEVNTVGPAHQTSGGLELADR